MTVLTGFFRFGSCLHSENKIKTCVGIIDNFMKNGEAQVEKKLKFRSYLGRTN